MNRVLVTGADGFVGSRLSVLLQQQGYEVRRAVRSTSRRVHDGAIPIGDIGAFTDWPQLVNDIDAVVHLAARAHVTKDTDPEAYGAVNVAATIRLATAAAEKQVRRFVFVSSIGVNGSQSRGRPFTERDPPAPTEPYSISKWAAELALRRIQAETGLELVIVRPPLIYGPGAKGNLLRMLKLIALPIPLPLGGLDQPRNFIGLDNLCALLTACVKNPDAAGEVLLAAEPERRSTSELLKALSTAMGRRHQIWPCPLSLLTIGAAAAGKRAELVKLAAPLEVDGSRAMEVLGWRPHQEFAEGIRATVESFLSSRA